MKKAMDEPDREIAVQQQPRIEKRAGRVRLCATKIQNATAAVNASRQISGDSNQSSRWPRSIINCSPVIATDSARNPVQSSWARLRSLYSASADPDQIIATMPGGTIMKKAARQL